MKQSKFINISIIVMLGLMIMFVIYAMHNGIFDSSQSFEIFVNGFGFWAIAIFILIQVTSVVITVLPTSIGCVAGVVLFGPINGFIYNYIGICIGAFISFALARHYGSDFVQKIIPEQIYNKYISSIDNTKMFEKGFALAIFFPFAPDDILCYLAGLSKIRWYVYTMIIILGKPVSLLLYSIGITAVINYFV